MMEINPFWEQAKRAMANRKPIQEVEDKLPPFPALGKESDYRNINDYNFEDVRGHIEVFKDKVFQFSADTLEEARQIFNREDF